MTAFSSRPQVSRRRLLAGGGGALAVALTGGGAVWSARQAFADDVEGGYFDLTVPSEMFIREQPIHHNTVLQSFVFDDERDHVYVLQVIEDGVQLPGEPEPVPWEERTVNGDMCVTKIDHDGVNLGHMFLKGFGHGVACGLEPDGDEVHLWTEVDAGPDENHHPTYGFGRAIARFPFVDEQVLEYDVDDVEVHRPKPDTTGNLPSVDILNRRLLLQHTDDSSGEPEFRYAVYDLDEVKAGVYEPIYELSQVGIEPDEVFQGLVLFGDYVYQMTGAAYTDEDGDNPPSERGNCHVSSVDVRTGELVERFRTEAGYTLPFREPEGLAVQLTQPPRLYMGFAGGVAQGRDVSLYYKEQVD